MHLDPWSNYSSLDILDTIWPNWKTTLFPPGGLSLKLMRHQDWIHMLLSHNWFNHSMLNKPQFTEFTQLSNNETIHILIQQNMCFQFKILHMHLGVIPIELPKVTFAQIFKKKLYNIQQQNPASNFSNCSKNHCHLDLYLSTQSCCTTTTRSQQVV